MIRSFLLVLALAALAVPGSSQTPSRGAAERRVALGSFDRVRVDGTFDVTYATGSPGARVSGDREAIEDVEMRLEGSTLRVRRGGRTWGERPAAAAGAPITVALSSPSLVEAQVLGGGRLRVTRPRGARLDLLVAGTGEVGVSDVAAERLAATLAGTGSMTLTGKARQVSLRTNGPGRIDASGLLADDLTVLLDGRGETRAAARVTAKVTNAGLGSVVVTGRPKCTVAARAGGPVTCGGELTRFSAAEGRE